ncbi:MAG: hypothetical protein PHC97_03330 [Patescibacteria group bacterium]|nr:hypothetical protein [Patescibacteria group bacterium]
MDRTKIVLLIISIVFLSSCNVLPTPNLNNQNLPTGSEQGCLNSGGQVTTSSCCASVGDFPNNCLIGACGCSPTGSHQVKTCGCGTNQCFNGSKCMTSSVPAETINFTQTGNIAKNSPGFKTDIWYLVYEQVGSPALNVELSFDEKSMCEINGQTNPCLPGTFNQGDRATVSGIKNGSVVLVRDIQFLAQTVGSSNITLADNNKTINMKVGDNFLLDLGDQVYNWAISVSDQSVVSREVNILVIRGAQGVYKAHKAGSATLTAVGDPLCRQSKPACAIPSILFTLKVNVR